MYVCMYGGTHTYTYNCVVCAHNDNCRHEAECYRVAKNALEKISYPKPKYKTKGWEDGLVNKVLNVKA